MNRLWLTIPVFAACGLASLASGQPCGNAWVQWSGQGPGGRNGFSLAYDSGRQRVVMVGGSPIPGSGLLTDTWEWDGSGTGTWTQRAATGIPGRWNAALAYDAARARTILFGGITTSAPLNDTWEWDGTTWTQRFPNTSPPARYWGLMDFDAARSVIVLASGTTNGATWMADTWEWDGANWAQRSATHPSPTGSMAYDAARQRIVMLAYTEFFYLPWGLLEWDGGAWTPRPTINTPQSGPIRFDPRLSRLTVPGYGLQGYDGWTWVLEPGDIWEVLSSQHPTFDYSVVVAFDGYHMLDVGNVYSTYGLQTWIGDSLVHSGPTITQPVTPSGPPLPGIPLSLTAAASGNGPLQYRWRRNGVNLNNGPGITGADTPQLTLTNPGLASNGAYSIAVTDSCGTTIPPMYQLDVPCYANCDRNAALNANDFQCFINGYAAGCFGDPLSCYHNCDRSTVPPVLNANDFQCFINAFAAGCT